MLEIATGIIILVFLSVIWAIFLKKREQRAYYSSLDMSLFLIRMPKYDKNEEKLDIKNLIGSMEQVYANFLYMKNPQAGIFAPKFRMALEIACETGREDVSFYIAAPNILSSSMEKAISAVYPEAIIEKIDRDYTIFEPKCAVAASYLKLEKECLYPISTYAQLNNDPLSSISNSLSKIAPQEGAAIQIILQASDLNLKDSGEKLVVRMQQASNPMTAGMAQGPRNEVSRYLGMLASSAPAAVDQQQNQQAAFRAQRAYQVDQTTIDAIRYKIKKPIFNADIRLVAVAPDSFRAEEILQNLESSFSQFSSSFNGFLVKRVKGNALKNFVYDFSFRNFRKDQEIVLNLEELSSIYHFPMPVTQAANIKWAKTREVVLPEGVPHQGKVSVGKANYRGQAQEIFFAGEEDRRRHFYIVGQTGTGKSTLLFNMIRQDILNGEGVGLIDPHGDLVEKVLSIIPKNRVEDVVLFDPADIHRPVGLNMLEWDSPEQKDFVVSEMIMIFSKLFPPEIIGPMFEHYMRNAMLALMADKDNPGTLVEIPRIFTDKEYMENRLAMVSDPLVRSFWLKEWSVATGQTRSDMLGYVVSKVGRFVENEMMRNIIGQGRSGFDLSEIMNNKKIFLANLSKGRTGELNSSLLGLVLISKMQAAAMRRGEIPMEQRKDFYLYIDEFHNFTTDNIATMLSEARKYRLNLILAHQYMPQLQEQIKNAVLGNVGTIGCFRVGVNDAEFLEKQYEPQFSRYDLINVENFGLILKMMIEGHISSPFKINISYPASGNQNNVEPVKKISKLKYGRPKAMVETEIKQRWNF